MSDSPLLAFAIGSLAASRGASETARLAVDVMTPRRAQPTVNVNGLIQALQEQEQLIHDQNTYIENLQRERDEWKAHSAETERRRAKLYDYAMWAEAELKKYTSQK